MTALLLGCKCVIIIIHKVVTHDYYIIQYLYGYTSIPIPHRITRSFAFCIAINTYKCINNIWPFQTFVLSRVLVFVTQSEYKMRYSALPSMYAPYGIRDEKTTYENTDCIWLWILAGSTIITGSWISKLLDHGLLLLFLHPVVSSSIWSINDYCVCLYFIKNLSV